MGRIARAIGVMLGVMVCSVAGEARAQEYCVSCSEPDALYRCVIEGAQPRGSQSLQMLCVTAMARAGGHATCGVKSGTVFQCDGAVKRIPWTALDAARQPEPVQAPPGAPPTPKPAPTVGAPVQPAPKAPPQTVLELAKRANEKTAEQMKKAGDTMKQATKKTWDCMVSFFTRC